MGVISFKDFNKLTKLEGVIATVGDEPFFRDQVKNRIVSMNKELEIVKIDCEEVKEQDVFSTLHMQDLFSGKKICILYNFIKIKNLSTLFEDTFPNIILLDSEKAGRSKQFEELKKKITYVECSRPKPWDAESDALGKIIGFFKVRGFSIDESTAGYLYGRIGYNLYRLVNEMQKVILLKEETPSKEVSREDIDKICSASNNFSIFDIIDRVIEGDKKSALNLLSIALTDDPNSAVPLLTLWYTHLENILFLKNSSKKEEEITQFVRMPPMVIKKKLRPQAAKLSSQDLYNGMAYLMDADVKLRRGFYDTRFYLENFVIKFPTEL